MMFKRNIFFRLFSILFIFTAVTAYVYANQLSILKELLHKEMAMQELSVKICDFFHGQKLDVQELGSFLQTGQGKSQYVFIYLTYGLTCPACRESMTEFAKEINRSGKHVDYIEIRCGEMSSENRSAHRI